VKELSFPRRGITPALKIRKKEKPAPGLERSTGHVLDREKKGGPQRLYIEERRGGKYQFKRRIQEGEGADTFQGKGSVRHKKACG